MSRIGLCCIPGRFPRVFDGVCIAKHAISVPLHSLSSYCHVTSKSFVVSLHRVYTCLQLQKMARTSGREDYSDVLDEEAAKKKRKADGQKGDKSKKFKF
jgi:hypothetical protein